MFLVTRASSIAGTCCAATPVAGVGISMFGTERIRIPIGASDEGAPRDDSVLDPHHCRASPKGCAMTSNEPEARRPSIADGYEDLLAGLDERYRRILIVRLTGVSLRVGDQPQVNLPR